MIKETLVLLLFVFIFYSAFIEPRSIKKEKIAIPLKDVSSQISQMVFVQISDVHFKKSSLKAKKLIKILEEISPDYLFITGDLIDRKTKNLKDFQEFILKLAKIPKNPPLMVLGNHEHTNPKINEFLKIIEQSGIKILFNQKILLKDKIVLIGLDDPHTHHDNIEKILPVSEDVPKIILAHSPEIFRKIDLKNGIVFCGHTHGGQIDIPFFTKLILPLSYDKNYKKGLFSKDSLFMYVNRGIGETFLPLRFNSPPEITIIKFLQND